MLRLMTYNILDGGFDAGSGASRLEAIAEVVRQAAPDILVLNECNDFDQEGRRRLFALEHAIGMRIELARAQSGFHVAVGVRTETPVAKPKPRLRGADALSRGLLHAALAAQIAWGDRELTLVATHLSPFESGARLAEARLLVRYARQSSLVFVLGDLNAISPHDKRHVDPRTWSPTRRARHLLPGSEDAVDTRVLETFEQHGFVDVDRRLHPGAFRPTVPTALGEPSAVPLRIDYVLASPPAAERARRSEVITSGLAPRASDHYPLCVDFDL